MCGIVGWVDSIPEKRDVLEAMTETLSHRGPDAQGIYYSSIAALGHRRLSILDLEGSSQPMQSEEGRYVLTYNGELYNFQELRSELEALGRVFRTKGDTEVVLQSLIVWGEEACSKFLGMFAFAFWDAKEKTLLLARDHMGVKPLYYSCDRERILFASEIKALLVHPACSKEVSPNAIGLYLECQYIPAPYTIFERIQKLLPAHILKYEKGLVETRRYWLPSYAPKWEYDEETALDLLEKELCRSVRSMMIADVPVGAFVSGGIDSSLIAAIMQKESGRKTEMFSIALHHSHGEQQHAETVAKYLGSHFHPLVVQPQDMIEALETSFDEPLGDQASLPTLLLSKLTRRHVKVALTGEGADELFAGYSNYAKRLKDQRLCKALHASPLPLFYPWFPMKLRKSRLCKAMARPLSRRYTTIPHIFCRESYRSLLARPFLSAQYETLEQVAESYYHECNSPEYLDKMLHIDTRLWLADDLLTKVDRATMAHSLEARVPYLDHKFVEFVCRLPAKYKLQGMEGKVLLKKWAARKWIPPEIAYRPKWGFVMPLGDWMAKELRPLVDGALSEGGLMGRNLFQKKALQDLQSQRKKSDAARLFSLLSLELWFRKYLPDYKFSS